jgi:hypothetical protein
MYYHAGMQPSEERDIAELHLILEFFEEWMLF